MLDLIFRIIVGFSVACFYCLWFVAHRSVRGFVYLFVCLFDCSVVFCSILFDLLLVDFWGIIY